MNPLLMVGWGLFLAGAGSPTAALRALHDYEPVPPEAYHLAPPAREANYQVSRLDFPSPRPSGHPSNDTVVCLYFRPPGPGPFVGVVVVHGLGPKAAVAQRRVCEVCAAHGVATLLVTLPYHLERNPTGKGLVVPPSAVGLEGMVEAMLQASADIRAAIDWLERQPEIDPGGIGIVGISIGAILTNLVMGLDARVRAGVSILGGGDLPHLLRRSPFANAMWPGLYLKYSPAELRERLAPVDPLTFADANRPRTVFFLNGSRDTVIVPSSTRALWEALDRPPIRWVPTGHFGLVLYADQVAELSHAFLSQALSESVPPPLPRWRVFPLMAGLWIGQRGPAPGVASEWVFGDGTFAFQGGLTGLGPFAGLAYHPLHWVTVGYGVGLADDQPNIFGAFHLTF